MPIRQAIKLPIVISNNVYLQKVKGKVTIEGNIKPGLIEIGYGNLSIFDRKRSRTVWEVYGDVVFKGKASIGHGSKISVHKDGVLIFGNDFCITAESSIIASKRIEFGERCLLSWDILIMDTDFHKVKDNNNKILNPPKEIKIGDKVWIGCRCLILKGATIPSKSIIAANSFVGKELIGENQVFGGSPVIVLKNDVTWDI